MSAVKKCRPPFSVLSTKEERERIAREIMEVVEARDKTAVWAFLSIQACD